MIYNKSRHMNMNSVNLVSAEFTGSTKKVEKMLRAPS